MSISSLSNYEYTQLIGHYNSIKFKEEIDPRLLDKGYTPEVLEQIKQGMTSKATEIISLNLKLKGPFDRFKYPYFDYVLTLFEQYNSNGAMPYPGSHHEQPSKIIEIFGILNQLKYEAEEQQQKEHERKAKKQDSKARVNGRR